MVPPDSRRISRVRRYSGYSWVSLRFAYGAATRSGRPFKTVRLRFKNPVMLSHNPDLPEEAGLAYSAFARRY